MFFLLGISKGVVGVVVVVEEMIQIKVPVKRRCHCPNGTEIILTPKIFQNEKDIIIEINKYY